MALEFSARPLVVLLKARIFGSDRENSLLYSLMEMEQKLEAISTIDQIM